MTKHIDIKVTSKEKTYFAIKVVVALIGYVALAYGFYFLSSTDPLAALPVLLYVVIFALYILFSFGILVGYIKGNAVKVTAKQFPDVYNILVRQCEKLNLSKIPDMYLMQSDGVLNAFATRFLGSNYIVVYSEIFEEAYGNNIASVEFVIGHELGHIKRKHMAKKMLLFPSFFVPFLNSAYSRACELTCDNIGAALSPRGVQSGLLMLAAGKKLWSKVNLQSFVEQEQTEFGFWFWFAEKISSHPRLSKRVLRFKTIETAPKSKFTESKVFEKPATDHSAFFPKN